MVKAIDSGDTDLSKCVSNLKYIKLPSILIFLFSVVIFIIIWAVLQYTDSIWTVFML